MESILILGGAGHMASGALDAVVQIGSLDEIVIADRDGERADAVAAALGGRARGVRLDINDNAALSALIERSSIVANFVGPYFRHGARVLDTAIEVGRPYVDINDDWEPTQEMLSRNAAAAKRGVTAVIGVGLSPGVTNMLAASAAARLDTIDALHTGWTVAGAAPSDDIAAMSRGEAGPSAALVHLLHQISGTITLHRDGGARSVKPLEAIEFEYPGIGACRGFSMGHPEPITLPRWRPGIRDSVNIMGISTRMADGLRALAAEIDEGRLSVEAAAEHMGAAFEADAEMFAPDPDRGVAPIIFALATGTSRGRPAVVGATVTALPDTLEGWTGVPLAVGVQLLLEGRVRGTGVLAPEMAFATEDFFAALEPHCAPRPDPAAPFVQIDEKVL